MNNPYWTITELDPYWTIFEGSPYWTIPGIAPYWTIPYYGTPYWTISAKTNFKEFKGEFFKFFKDLSGSKKALKKLAKHEFKIYKKIFKEARKEAKKFRKNFDPEVQWNNRMVLGNNFEYEDAGSGVQVAILDTGVDASHPDLGNVVWEYDATGFDSPADINGHGTHLSGIVAAEKDGVGMTGLAPDAELYSIKVILGDGTPGEWEWATEGIYAALRGPDGVMGTEDDADVISMSFDSRGEYPPQFFYDAVQLAYSMGVPLVAAAGNAGDGDIMTTESDTWPASYDEVIAVGAVDIFGMVANYSNNLAGIEMMAPGHFIYSTFLEGQYVWWGGTSMAAPHVSAVLALLIQEYGKLPVGDFDDMGDDTLRGLLHLMAADFLGDGWDPYYGYGIVQFTDD